MKNVEIKFGFLQPLTIAFVVLKLCGVITWSWWWVLAPVWIPLSVAFIIFVGAVAIKAKKL
jgi:hypothetical protein